MREKILIVEDQFIEANNLQLILERAGHEVCSIARSVPAALRIVEEERPTMVLLDIYLQGPLTGIALAPTLREKNIAFIYLSANSNKETLEAAKATYPYGFLVKPARKKDILVMLEIAQYLHEHSLESLRRRGELQKDSDGIEVSSTTRTDQRDLLSNQNFGGIIGKSQLLKTALNHLKIVAPTETSVLILGESGTGKERFAGLVHQLSSRKSKPIVNVNCAALPTNLVESELFGHERGSFTGATERRIGKFEQAQDGTIFLDEIGELPLEVQVKFLRVLQEKEIDRIGSKSSTRLNVRIIAATNRSLEREVAEGRFRMDLYYRLNVFPLVLPPLRERKEDIPLLASHFAAHYSKAIGKKVNKISDGVLQGLFEHDWPGNIRELEHTIERAVLMTSGNEITHIDLPQIDRLKNLRSEEKVKTIEEVEREHIIDVLKHCNGKISGQGGAADLLKINVATLQAKMKKLGIRKENPRFMKPDDHY